MLGFSRRAASSVWTAALVVLLFCLVYLLRTTLFVFILALLFAYLLAPLVNFFDRRLPGDRSRTIALSLSYILLVGIAIVIITQIGSRAVDEANTLAKKFPDMIQHWEKPAAGPGADSLTNQILDKVRIEIASRSSGLISALPAASLKVLSLASNLLYVVLIPILGFFFLKDGSMMRQHILDMVNEGPRRVLLDEVLADVNLLLASYMRALVLLSAAAFTAYSIFFSIVGLQFGVLLAAGAALLEFIPMIGPLTGGITIVVVAALTGSNALAILIFLLSYRVLQDYVISPHIMGQGVELHPLLVLFGVFAGAEIAGVAGTFLSVPVLALIRIVYRRIRKSRIETRLTPEPTGSL